MSGLVQDVQFFEEDTPGERTRKLRILQDELVRIGQAMNQVSVLETGVVDFGAVTVDEAAAVPAATSGFITVTVNGVTARVALFPPA